MKKQALLSAFILASLLGNSQTKKQKDQQAIKSMSGCYEVSFNFTETFKYTKDSTYKASKNKHAKALEWVELIENEDNKISLQHLLIVGNKEKPMIIKHWRQDWLYENTDLYAFDHANKWNYVALNSEQVRGQWTQKVFQVDDSPRYEGSATWVHVDGKSKWENTTDAPLPRREYTKRSDYNVTKRTNTHAITNFGWIHDQDNDKIVRKSGEKDILLAQEKGVNTYTKVADNDCKAASNWWNENKEKWALVRKEWDFIFAQNKNLKLKSKVEGKRLYEVLFSEDLKVKSKPIHKAINSFVEK